MKKYKKILAYFSFVCVLSCNKDHKDDIEIKILNEELYAYSSNIQKDTINILKVEVINNSNTIYYFNDIINTDNMRIKGLFKKGMILKIFNEKDNKEIYYKDELPSDFGPNRSFNDSISQNLNSQIQNLELERLNSTDKFIYYSTKDFRNNFFIHPKEKIYLEVYLNITGILPFEHDRMHYADLSNKNKYYGKLFFVSDSTSYKTELPRHILKTIGENEIKVYHGIIESKNEVPIKIIN